MKQQVLVWLDDVRHPLENDWLVFSPLQDPYKVVWVKDYNEFVDYIINNGLPTGICFDHDLGEGKSGFDCCKFLVEYCLDNELNLPKYNIQSANPVGKENIISLLTSFTKNTKYD